ncbi:transcription factor bHLH155-like isoform X2 [Nymphaea colorata]|nr:transcription factor bHLH155-like isoform X2 [Nymphaea colorata]
MGTSRMSMYQLLGSFCQNRGWNYAVFWRLKNQNSKLLTCSETYFSFPKSPHVIKFEAKKFPFNNTVNSVVNRIDGFYGPDVGDSLELAVANMSRLVYYLGEGSFGQIAIARKHHWICSGRSFGGGENSTVVELPDEWKAQFAVGIKTIALIPVMPCGLVQLGSLETLEEDMELVEYIRLSFSSLRIPSGTGSPLTSVGCLSELPTALHSFMPQISVSSAISYDLSDQTSHASPEEKHPGFAVLDADNKERKLSKIHSSVLKFAEDLQMPQNGLYRFGPDRCYSGREAGAVSKPLPKKIETLSTQNWFTESCLEQNLANNVTFDPYLETEICLGDSRLTLQESASDQTFANRFTWGLSQTIDDDNFKFPASSELHKALGQAVYTGGNNCFGNSAFGDEDGFSGANAIVDQFNLEGRLETLLGDFEDWFMDGNRSEHLLDAIVADTCLLPENKSLSSQSGFAKPSDNLLMDFDAYFEMQDSIIDSATDNVCEHPGGEDMQLRSTDMKPSSCERKAACAKLQKTDTQAGVSLLNSDHWSVSHNSLVSWAEQSAMTSPTGSSITLSTLIDEVKKNPASVLSKNEVKLPKINRKRAKPGESCRPRPRDRQQIQDRIKELREIVPNGAKCSIDALFERTIKHMLFLRSIASHVDKLKNCTRPKVIKEENSNSEKSNGASWAVELGSQSGSCPLIVENLSQPGHMLVEMLCEEHGIFLEIAQVIRSLGLTILKGEMETRAEKIWAHFVIEVTRGFQRMDILWPLMQLLQPRSNVTLSKF